MSPSCTRMHTHTHAPMQVNVERLDPDKACIQITHVVPFFDEKELVQRQTKFEREDKISRFLFETPFNTAGKSHGPIANQWMRKTILTSEPAIVIHNSIWAACGGMGTPFNDKLVSK